VELLSGNRLNRLLEIEIAFTGVAEPLAGREIGPEGQIRIAPVRQTGAVAEDVPGGDRRCMLVGRQVSGQVVAERRVERQKALIRELEDGVRKDRFA
jgi:hypothetical protein